MLNLRVSDDLQNLVLVDYGEDVERKQLEIYGEIKYKFDSK